MQISSTDEVKQLGTILGVWAHPDDEIFNAGGLLAAAIRNGQEVICVSATRGELGVQDESRWPAAELGAIRQKELYSAYGILGIHHHHWLGYKDGSCAEADADEAAARLAELIEMYKPDTVITFGPDGMTGHPDHQTVSRWTAKAAGGTRVYHIIQTDQQYDAAAEADKALNVYFNIDRPRTCRPDECDAYLTLDDDLYGLKLKALAAMPSQMEKLLESFEDSLRPFLGIEAFVKAPDD